MPQVDNHTRIVSKMARICSAREYCEYDIEQKLVREGVGEEDVKKIMAYLIENRFVDNLRYSCAFVRDKSRLKGWGSRKIIYALKSRRVPGDVIEMALREIGINQESENLAKVIEAKAASIGLNRIRDFDEMNAAKNRLIRFAIGRGFEYGKVFEAVNKIMAKFAKK